MSLRIKLILLFIFLMAIVMGSLVYYLNIHFKNYLKNQILNNFQILAELSESSYYTFSEIMRVQTADWASDGYIRETVEKILEAKNKGDEKTLKTSVSALNYYLREVKIKANPEALIIDVLDKNGVVIASSRDERLGEDESEESIRFDEAIKGKLGEAFITNVVIEEYEHPTEPMIHVITRIFSTSSSLPPLDAALLLHFINADKLNKILTGEFQSEQGAPTGNNLFKHYQTSQVYLVNQDRLMITHSRLAKKAILKQKVNTEPVKACFEQGKEISAEYLDFNNKLVLGVSMCLKRDNLTLILEAQAEEVLAPIKHLQRQVIFAGLISLMLGVIGISFLSYLPLKGLAAVISVVQEISKGNLTKRAKVKSKDEVGYLAKVFNELIDNTQRKDKIMSLIRDIVININEAQDINNAYQAIIEKICVYGNWLVGHAYLRDKNSDVLISTKIWHLSDPEKFKIFKEVTEKTNFKKGEGLPGRILESGDSVWISDVTKDINFPRAKLIENINIGAAFGFPVVSGDNKVIAIFEFFSTEPKEMDNGFLEAIKNISSQINGVVERIRFKEQLEERVKERTAELTEARAGLEETVAEKTFELQKRLDELEKFKKLTIGRELKMVEFKKEIETLKRKVGDNNS